MKQAPVVDTLNLRILAAPVVSAMHKSKCGTPHIADFFLESKNKNTFVQSNRESYMERISN